MSEWENKVKIYYLSPEELAKYVTIPYPKPCVMPPDINELMMVKREIKQQEPKQREPIPLKLCLRCGNMIPQDKDTTVYSYAQRKFCGQKCAGAETGKAKKGKKINKQARSHIWEDKIKEESEVKTDG